MTHQEQVGRALRQQRRIVHAARSHRLPAECVARPKLPGCAATAGLEKSRRHDHELMAQASFLRHPRPGLDAYLVDVGEQAPQLGVIQTRKLASRAQDPQALAVVHSGMRPSPTPPEKARSVSGVTRFRSRSAPKLSPWTSTANATMPSARARSARAATSLVPIPWRCHSSATTIARSASREPATLTYCATATTSPRSVAATASRSWWSVRRTEAMNWSGLVMGLKNRR